MSVISFKISYKRNEGLVMSPSELQQLYFHGIPLKDKLGNTISSETIANFIRFAQEEVEKWLNIKLIPQLYIENRDFHSQDWQTWGYIRTSYPIAHACYLEGWIAGQKQITYPSDWITTKKSNDGKFYRQLFLMPNMSSKAQSGQSGIILGGMFPIPGSFNSMTFIPNYWKIAYITGFTKGVPADLIGYIGKLASLNVFHIAGALILGAGVNSTSLGIDGLSQSITIDPGYSNRIKAYLDDLTASADKISSYYKGITILSM